MLIIDINNSTDYNAAIALYVHIFVLRTLVIRFRSRPDIQRHLFLLFYEFVLDLSGTFNQTFRLGALSRRYLRGYKTLIK